MRFLRAVLATAAFAALSMLSVAKASECAALLSFTTGDTTTFQANKPGAEAQSFDRLVRRVGTREISITEGGRSFALDVRGNYLNGYGAMTGAEMDFRPGSGHYPDKAASICPGDQWTRTYTACSAQGGCSAFSASSTRRAVVGQWQDVKLLSGNTVRGLEITYEFSSTGGPLPHTEKCFYAPLHGGLVSCERTENKIVTTTQIVTFKSAASAAGTGGNQTAARN